MPEINPYEPPQAELRSTSSVPTPSVTDDTRNERLFLAILLSLQGLAVVLAFLSLLFNSNQFLSPKQMKTLATIFGLSFLVLGIAVLPLALMRRSRRLAVLEIVVLVIFVWLMLPAFR